VSERCLIADCQKDSVVMDDGGSVNSHAADSIFSPCRPCHAPLAERSSSLSSVTVVWSSFAADYNNDATQYRIVSYS